MKVKALISFSGLIAMTKNEIRDIENKEIYSDLIKAGYVEQIKEQKSSRKKVTTDED